MKTSFSFQCIVQKRYFTVENVQPIVDRFGCKDSSESLARQLNYAAGEFDANRDPSTLAAGKEDRTFFREMAQLAERLKERLGALGWEMTHFEEAANRFETPIDLQNFTAQLDQVAFAAKYREKQIPDESPGRPDNAPLKNLVADLHKIYQEQTGKTSRTTYDPATNEYIGEFFSFVEDCLAVIGVKTSNNSLGHIVRRVRRK